MKLLAIDASGDAISLAVLKAGAVKVEIEHCEKNAASRLLVPLIEKCTKQAKLKLKNYDAFVIGSGPGSFTGLRISFSVVKALSLTLNKPIISLSSYCSLVYPFKDKEVKIAVIGDARRQLIYGSVFKRKAKGFKLVKKIKLYQLSDFVKANKDCYFISSCQSLLLEAGKFYPGLNFYSKSLNKRAKFLALEAVNSYNNKEFTLVGKLEPLYIHPKTCQIRRQGG